jgi:hypothetical protein
MPPAPKHPSARARVNKTSTAAKLKAADPVAIPELPPNRPWHPQTTEWWADVWRSPMASEFDQSDVHGMLMLAVLVDDFWLEPSTGLASEIRLQGQRFGLSPLDRRRLQWEIEKVDEAVDRRQTRQTDRTPRKRTTTKDPRDFLRAL